MLKVIIKQIFGFTIPTCIAVGNLFKAYACLSPYTFARTEKRTIPIVSLLNNIRRG